jgi:predicted phosphodiesterase
MKYAITADIHANLPALTAVMRDIEQQGCDRIVCLGDLVVFGFQPLECVKLVREQFYACVRGNHDEHVGLNAPPDSFTAASARSVRWTSEQLDDGDRRWLLELPLTLELDGFTLVHANLEAPQRWGYAFETLGAQASFRRQRTPVCFFGHTHFPMAFVRDAGVRGGTYEKFRVETGKQYFVNPGSVGQPRDQNPDAAYAIYDLAQQTIELRRVPFPRKAARGTAAA